RLSLVVDLSATPWHGSGARTPDGTPALDISEPHDHRRGSLSARSRPFRFLASAIPGALGAPVTVAAAGRGAVLLSDGGAGRGRGPRRGQAGPGSPVGFRVPDRRAGGYALGEPLGAGGMAAVYGARDELLDRDVAVKLVVDDGSLGPDFARACVREARA